MSTEVKEETDAELREEVEEEHDLESEVDDEDVTEGEIHGGSVPTDLC